MVLGKLPVPGCPTIWIIVGQGPTGLAVGAGVGCLGIFSLVYHFSFHTPSLWETARYRLKYCLKVPLSPNQPANQSTALSYSEEATLPFQFLNPFSMGSTLKGKICSFFDFLDQTFAYSWLFVVGRDRY